MDSFHLLLFLQSRITIERTFGQIVNRWGVLWQPMRFSLPRVSSIVQAILRLHNFGINFDLRNGRQFKFRGHWSVPVKFKTATEHDPLGEALDDERFIPAQVAADEVAREECADRHLTLAQYGHSATREAIRLLIGADASQCRPATRRGPASK